MMLTVFSSGTMSLAVMPQKLELAPDLMTFVKAYGM